MQGAYQLDVHYPLHLLSRELDESIADAVGKPSGSSGGGVTGRDMQFYFDSPEERMEAAKRIRNARLMLVSVVQREDLDPTPDHPRS